MWLVMLIDLSFSICVCVSLHMSRIQGSLMQLFHLRLERPCHIRDASGCGDGEHVAAGSCCHVTSGMSCLMSWSCDAISRHHSQSLSCESFQFLPCHVMPCYVNVCHVMPCHMSGHAMSCEVMQLHAIRSDGMSFM